MSSMLRKCILRLESDKASRIEHARKEQASVLAQVKVYTDELANSVADVVSE